MTKETTNDEQAVSTDMVLPGEGKVTPDELLGDFKGRPLSRILVFTILAHVVVIGVFSLGYIKEQAFGKSTAKMTDAQRMKQAVDQSTQAIRKIAEQNHVDLRDLSSRFANGKDNSAEKKSAPQSQQPTQSTATSANDQQAAKASVGNPKKGESAIEKKLKRKEKAPSEPSLNGLGNDNSFSDPNTP